MVWIANGEAGSSVRGKLNSLSIPISSVSISSPVEYVDITLPSGYTYFVLNATTITLVDGSVAPITDSLIGCFSFDGGVTFVADSINNDSYLVAGSVPAGLFYIHSFSASLADFFARIM